MLNLTFKSLANCKVPESCAGGCEVAGEALTGLQTGQVLSPEIMLPQDADAVEERGRPQWAACNGESCSYPAGSETLSMFACNNLRENREILCLAKSAKLLVRVGKSKDVRQ